MSSFRTLGLTVVVALMATASVCAPSAMAESTAYCNVDPGTGQQVACSAGHLVTHLHETTLAGLPANMLSSVLDVICDVLFLGDTVGSLSSPLIVVGKFTYTNCGNCTAKDVTANATYEVLKLGHENADLLYEFDVFVECGSVLKCTYRASDLPANARGPLLSGETNGSVSTEEGKMAKLSGGFLCPKEAFLDITTTPLTATYITN